MIRWFQISRLLLAFAALTALSTIDSADAVTPKERQRENAKRCEQCKERCREGVKKCKKAGPKRLCEGPAKIVCDMFKNFQCPAAGSVCRQFDCGTSSACDPPKPRKGGKVSGDPHVYSLDRTRFDFQGAGEYALAKSEEAEVEFQARFTPVGDSVSLTTMAAIRSGGHRVVFEAGGGVMIDKQSIQIEDGTIFLSETVSLHPVAKNRYLLEVGETRLWVTSTRRSLNLSLEPDPKSRGTWQGLLGDFDGVSDNDFRTREGKAFVKTEMSKEILYGEFGNSWRLSQSESFLVYAEGETTETHTDKSFPKKHRSIADFDKATFDKARVICIAKGVSGGEALRNCIYDVGITDSEDYAEGYADAREIEAKSSLIYPGELAMHVQDSSHQGAFVPVFWAGATEPEVHVTLHTELGKKIASTRSKGANPIMVRLPSEVGTYALKLNQGEQSVERNILITEATATLTVPETVAGATEFTVTWTGPIGRGDYVSLVKGGETRVNRHLSYFWANRTKDAVFQSPAVPGDYEVWYVLAGSGGAFPIAKKTIKVGEASASVTPPASVIVGADFPLPWTGPDGEGDYIDLVRVGHTKTQGQLHYNWTHKSKEGAVTLRAPAHPGKYDIRYIASTSAGRAVLSTATMEVIDAKAEVILPPSAIVGEKFEISWTGPMHKNDFVAVGPVGSKAGRGNIHYVWAKPEGKGMLRAPSKPGTYEVTYVLQGSDTRRVLLRKQIVIKEK